MFKNFIELFQKCFIEENRYQLILKGLQNTITMSLCAVLIGTILGLLLALMKITEVKKGKRTFASTIAGIYIDIMRGTPSVVQLMIIWSIIFKSRYSLIAGIVSFGLNSAAYVSEIIRGGIMSINKGQTEASRSLGLSYNETMRYIIIPQAVKNILPALGNEFIVLVKETAVVGMVGIIDLMKSSDIIISRVYTVTLPLITVAVIYYILLKLLAIGLNAFERRLRKNDLR